MSAFSTHRLNVSILFIYFDMSKKYVDAVDIDMGKSWTCNYSGKVVKEEERY